MQKSLAAVSLSLGLILSACHQAPAPQPAENSVAPFMDTNKVARAVGGTLEWNKMEGLAYDARSRTLYIAVTAFSGGMADQLGDIRMAANPCGGIIAAQLDSNLSATRLTPILAGKPTADGKGCDVNGLNSPDNLSLDQRGRLWIGEDGDDTRNALWAYDLKAGSLKRFAVVPDGAEVTGLRVSEQGDLFMNIQHPGKNVAAPYNKGTVGVFSGFNANRDDFTELAYDGTSQPTLRHAAGQYTVLVQSGENGAGVITNADGSSEVSTNPDANMLVPTGPDSAILYTNWESQPGGVSRLDLKRSGGSWVADGQPGMVDFMGVRGTWNNCNGSVTPWKTALTSEEYPAEDDATWAEAEPNMSKYLGRKANRYDYGYISEITPSGAGQSVKKHYVMGRNSYEMSLVLSDNRTVHFGDDGNMRGMYKFVADKAGDLSAGTLYVAKLEQVDDQASATGQSFTVKWMKLGHGVDSEIEAAIARLN
ncbi:alkaline phosphatase PhoX [Deinococcus sp. Marseille-Q6407]|uniref:alkaline phosphatase PhoX n=1 Tax=Deinococcus sp. Marseille-Q6407 TaxID=2969223 RepID=UPI0021C138A8|nr:alkaline phosphatase PhoX [Deinococcus sp. Marseille-Q6407]